MIDAFKQLGYSVDTVTGDAKERRQRIKEIRNHNRKYKFCYSEPTTWPLHPLVDYRLYWYLRRNDIRTGIFYRDIYWQFPELFDYTGLKYWELQARYRLDLAVISRVANQMYVPSASFGEQLNLDVPMTHLPPGGVDRTSTTDSMSRLQRVIYVGGISERYGSVLLSKSLEDVAESEEIVLDLVCREEGFQSLSKEVRNRFDSDWVNVHHVHGEELEQFYQRADAGIIPLQLTKYNNMSVPVKLFEYLSYGLPIVTTNLDEVASFVKDSGCGIVCKANYEEMARALASLSSDEQLYQQKKKNAVRAVQQNRWVDRAEQVASDLTNSRRST